MSTNTHLREKNKRRLQGKMPVEKVRFNESVKLLRHIEVFTKLPEPLMRQVAKKMVKVHFNPGDELQKENQPWKALYVIADGTAEVFLDGYFLADRKPGDTIGELALLDDDPFRLSMIAKTPVTAWKLNREDFRRLTKNLLADTWNFLQLIIKRIKMLMDIQLRDKHEREERMETLRNYFLGRVMKLEGERDTLREVIDRIPTGIVLVDKAKKILLTNKSAQIVIQQADAFVIKRNELHAINASDNRKLQEVIKKAISDLKETEEESGGALIISRSSDSSSLPLLISPLRSREYTLNDQTACAVIFISDPYLQIPGPQEILKKLYGLTTTEARLSSALLQGRNVMQIAGENKIKVNTVRGHLKSIFLKTGANSQRDLVRILLTSPRIAS